MRRGQKLLTQFFKRSLAAAFIVGALVIVAPTQLRAQEPIRIGTFLSVTGAGAFLGAPALATLKLYVDLTNAQGGLLGRRLSLIQYDVGIDTRAAQTAVRRLIDKDKVDAIIGGSTTGAAMAVIPIIEQAGVPFLALAGSASITSPVRKWVFKSSPTERLACAKILADIAKRGIKNIALLSGDDGFGSAMAGHCRQLAEPMGIKIVADEVYRSRTRRVLRQMQRIQDNADVAAVVNIGFGGTTAYITQQFRRMKFKIPLYQSHAAANQDYLDLAGPAAEGVRMPVAPLVLSGKLEIGDPVRPVIAAYNKLYLGRWEVLPSVYGAHAHDAIQILIAAIRKARSTNKAALRRTIEATRGLVGTSGIYRINADDHLGLDVTSLRMAEVRSGAWEPVD